MHHPFLSFSVCNSLNIFQLDSWFDQFRICLSFQEMIDEADRDGDGEINEAEFLRIMKKTSLY